ncbi:MAG: sensor histidine kinase [Oscillospiraceae bacterium]|nr:sensor histidine kinase [Oscillospiraceae bacterium]
MRFTEFFRDRYFTYISCALTFAVMLVFMKAFHIQIQLIIIIGVIFWLMVIIGETWEFLRKRKFYNDLFDKLDSLDKKYLISEMLMSPGFYEGQLLCEILHQTDKSMYENAAEYRRSASEFREFIEMWVHEIKLPVSSLLLMTHNNKSEFSGKALEQLRRIDGYTDTVLYYARSENAEKDYLINDVSLKRTVSNVAVKNRESLLLRDVSLHTEGLDVNVLTDGKWLEFILGQLLSNSLKFFPEGRNAEIKISAEKFQDRTVLRFRDNGIGIPENDLPYIFEKSFTGENGRLGAGSTGMGLYIVKNLCSRLGHEISVNSIKNEFTEFEIIFTKNDFYKFE